MSLRRKRFRFLLLGSLALGYLVVIALTYLHRHLQVPRGPYGPAIAGRWEITSSPGLQIPAVFRSQPLRIVDTAPGRAEIRGDGGRALGLVEGGDGYYFSQSFSPRGAWILPGIARNWNEGRIYRSGDALRVEGFMLEKGLSLFVLPFKDVARWELELRRAGDEGRRSDERPEPVPPPIAPDAPEEGNR